MFFGIPVIIMIAKVDVDNKVANSAVLELPETGAHIGYGLLLAGMACMSMGMYAGRKRRKGKYAGKG